MTYREAANVFEVMDNVSGWWDGKCDPEYRTYWQRRFPIRSEDERAFRAYAAIRRRYYAPASPVESESGLFAPRKPPDRLADAFYGSETVEDALARARSFATAEDVAALEAFFRAFESRTGQLLGESRVLATFAEGLQRALDEPKTAAFVQRIAGAYEVSQPARLTVLYVWWPPVDHVTANNRGTVLLMKYHPEKHAKGAVRDTDVAIHEFVHFVSATRSDERKRVLTKAFLEGCDVPASVKPVNVIEEPLAVVQQKLFLRETDPTRLDFSRAWYGGDPWVGTYAKLLMNLVDQHLSNGGTVDEALMRRSAQLCAELRAAGG